MDRRVKGYSDNEVLKFCQAYVELGQGATYSAAYRQAFPEDSQGLSTDKLNKRASNLYKSERCQKLLAEIRQPVVESAAYDLERFTNRMWALSKTAEDAGEYSAAISAEVHAAKALGIYTDKHEITGTLTVANVFEELARRSRDVTDDE